MGGQVGFLGCDVGVEGFFVAVVGEWRIAGE